MLFTRFLLILSIVLLSIVTCQLSGPEKSFVYINLEVEEAEDRLVHFLQTTPVNLQLTWTWSKTRKKRKRWQKTLKQENIEDITLPKYE